MFQIVPFVMFDLSWKFDENPFSRFCMMLLTDKTRASSEEATYAQGLIVLNYIYMERLAYL